MRLTELGLKHGTDKAFWHRFTDFYQPYFDELRASGKPLRVLEIGVFRGDSMRLLRDYLRPSLLVGVDILEREPGWPDADNIHYRKADQGDRESLRRVFQEFEEPFDLVIDDGGHTYAQQFNSIAEGIGAVSSGGVYIVEDIHSSIATPGWHRWPARLARPWNPSSPLAFLYYVQARKILKQRGDEAGLAGFETRFLPGADVRRIESQVSSVDIFQRANLPFECWKCKAIKYDIRRLRCGTCGTTFEAVGDSMTAVLKIDRGLLQSCAE
jgi:hypothetical protein